MFKTKDSGKRIKFKTGMNRDVSEDKPRYDLIYLPMLTRLAEFCSEHLDFRFWQALSVWSGYHYLGWYEEEKKKFHDLYYK